MRCTRCSLSPRSANADCGEETKGHSLDTPESCQQKQPHRQSAMSLRTSCCGRQETRARLAAAALSPHRGRCQRRDGGGTSSGYLLVAAAAGRVRERQAGGLNQRAYPRAAAAGSGSSNGGSDGGDKAEAAADEAVEADEFGRPEEGTPKVQAATGVPASDAPCITGRFARSSS